MERGLAKMEEQAHVLDDTPSLSVRGACLRRRARSSVPPSMECCKPSWIRSRVRHAGIKANKTRSDRPSVVCHHAKRVGAYSVTRGCTVASGRCSTTSLTKMKLSRLLVGGTYRAEQDTDRLHKHRGIAVATSKRVIFLDKGLLGSKEVSEMPYRSIEGITHSTGIARGGVQITGLGMAGWRIEDVTPKEFAKLFADSVRALVESNHVEAAQTANRQIDSPLSSADELAQWAKLLNEGILTQDEFNAKKRQLLGL